MVKVLSFRFKQCFDPFSMLPVEGSSETRPFKHLSNHVFWSRYFRKYISYDGDVFWGTLMSYLKTQKNINKNFFVFQICPSELVAFNCLYYADNACHRQSMSYQTVFRFCISLKETFPNAITFTVINKYDKGAVVQIGTVFRPICPVFSRRII